MKLDDDCLWIPYASKWSIGEVMTYTDSSQQTSANCGMLNKVDLKKNI